MNTVGEQAGETTGFVLATILTLTVAAGCLSGGQDAPDGPATDESTNPEPVERIELSGCYEQGSGFGPPRTEFFRDAVPPGFDLVPFANEPSNQTVTFIANGLRCTTEEASTVRPLWFFLQVNPPDRLAKPNADRHLLALQTFTETGLLADTFEAWGTGSGSQADRVWFEATETDVSTRAGQVGAVRGDVEVELTTSVTGPSTPQTAGSARVFGAQNGSLTGAMDVVWTASQEGLEDGSGELSIQGTGPADLPVEAAGAGIAWHHWGQGSR